MCDYFDQTRNAFSHQHTVVDDENAYLNKIWLFSNYPHQYNGWLILSDYLILDILVHTYGILPKMHKLEYFF